MATELSSIVGERKLHMAAVKAGVTLQGVDTSVLDEYRVDNRLSVDDLSNILQQPGFFLNLR